MTFQIGAALFSFFSLLGPKLHLCHILLFIHNNKVLFGKFEVVDHVDHTYSHSLISFSLSVL